MIELSSPKDTGILNLSASETEWAEVLRELCDGYLRGEAWSEQDRRDARHFSVMLIERSRSRERDGPMAAKREMAAVLRADTQRGRRNV